MSMYGIFAPDGSRLGTVVKMAGEPASRRWVAYSIYPLNRPAGDENREGFPTRKQAVSWLQKQREQAK